MLTHRDHPFTRLGHMTESPALRAFVLGPDPDWDALVSGASKPTLPEGYIIRPEHGRFTLVCRPRGALGWIVGRYATEAEAIEAAHEEETATHECECGEIVAGKSGLCARCVDREHDERGDF